MMKTAGYIDIETVVEVYGFDADDLKEFSQIYRRKKDIDPKDFVKFHEGGPLFHEETLKWMKYYADRDDRESKEGNSSADYGDLGHTDQVQ